MLFICKVGEDVGEVGSGQDRERGWACGKACISVGNRQWYSGECLTKITTRTWIKKCRCRMGILMHLVIPRCHTPLVTLWILCDFICRLEHHISRCRIKLYTKHQALRTYSTKSSIVEGHAALMSFLFPLNGEALKLTSLVILFELCINRPDEVDEQTPRIFTYRFTLFRLELYPQLEMT